MAGLAAHGRTLTVSLTIALALGFALSDARLATWQALLPLFEWLETTWFGVIGKTWGAVFAVVEAVHLLGMADHRADRRHLAARGLQRRKGVR